MAKRNDISTRHGRARRRADGKQFNPSTLQPHTEAWMKENHRGKYKNG